MSNTTDIVGGLAYGVLLNYRHLCLWINPILHAEGSIEEKSRKLGQRGGAISNKCTRANMDTEYSLWGFEHRSRPQ